MITIIRKHWFLIILASLAVFLTAVWIILKTQAPKEIEKERLPEAKPLETPSSPFSESPGPVRYNVGAPPPRVPSQIEVFRVRNFSRADIADRLIAFSQEIGISISKSPISQTPNVLIWQQGEEFLAVNIPSGTFSFIGKEKIADGLSGQNAAQFAIRKVIEWRLVEGIRGTEVQGFVAVGTELREVSKLSDADTFIVVAHPELNSRPIAGSGQAQVPIEIKLTRRGELVGLNFQIHTPGESLGNFPIISWQQAVTQLQAGKGQTLWVTDESGGIPDPLSEAPLTRTNITNSYLAYFDSGDEQTVFQPVFVFEGDGETVEGEKRTLAVFVPAIRSELFIP